MTANNPQPLLNHGQSTLRKEVEGSDLPGRWDSWGEVQNSECRTQGKGAGLTGVLRLVGVHGRRGPGAPGLGGFRGGEFITGETLPWTQEDQSSQSIPVSASQISEPKLTCFISSSSRVQRRRYLGIRVPSSPGQCVQTIFSLLSIFW